MRRIKLHLVLVFGVTFFLLFFEAGIGYCQYYYYYSELDYQVSRFDDAVSRLEDLHYSVPPPSSYGYFDEEYHPATWPHLYRAHQQNMAFQRQRFLEAQRFQNQWMLNQQKAEIQRQRRIDLNRAENGNGRIQGAGKDVGGKDFRNQNQRGEIAQEDFIISDDAKVNDAVMLGIEVLANPVGALFGQPKNAHRKKPRRPNNAPVNEQKGERYSNGLAEGMSDVEIDSGLEKSDLTSVEKSRLVVEKFKRAEDKRREQKKTDAKKGKQDRHQDADRWRDT